MATANKPEFKSIEQAKKHILKNYLKCEDNLFISEKLFIANSAVNWIFANTKNPVIVNQYIADICKYLQGDYELYWKNGVLTKKKVIKNDKN